MSDYCYVITYLDESCSIIKMESQQEAIQHSNILEDSGITTTLSDNYEHAKSSKNEYLKRKIEILQSTINSLKKQIEP